MIPSQRFSVIAFIFSIVPGLLANTTTGTNAIPQLFEQSAEPAIALSETSGLLGRAITVSGTGFGPEETVDLQWRTTDESPTTSATTSTAGEFTAPFTLPDAENGTHAIYATGRTSRRQAFAHYTVARSEGRSSRISEGVYSTYATRIGLIGNTTSAGHLVHEHDYFVALPACTPTNCPGGPHWGEMTECGERCYVKVINPQTNACRVERILDLGPWFRVDDWWSPANQRYLNGLATNSTSLAQGYFAADAAQNGYNVGFGIGANGVGHDDTGAQGTRPVREVGNRAAIDLADGTWRSLNLTSDGTGARIRVELLWQTGADPSAQAQTCGHPLNQAASTNSPGPANPTFEGGPLAPLSSSQSPDGPSASAVHDGDSATVWQSVDASPVTASFTLDYGDVQSLTGIRWQFGEFGYASQMLIETSADGATWTSVGVYGNAESGQWRGQSLASEGRFVRFSFTNANSDSSLGHVAEVETWSTGGAVQSDQPTPLPIAGSNPDFPGSMLPNVASSTTANTSSPTRAIDGDHGTSWATTSSTTPGPASVTFDLGQVQQLSGIRWMYLQSGGADRMRLQVSNNGTAWTQLVTTSNRVPLTWEGWPTSVTARYVRFMFDNPNGSPVLGYLAEVEIWGPGSAFHATEGVAGREVDARRALPNPWSRVRRHPCRSRCGRRFGMPSRLRRRAGMARVK